MSVGSANATATSRLKQDYMRMKRDPVPYITAEPLPSNILEWHYVVRGPKSSPFEGGYYHGKLVFPREYPFKPPSIYMITPNGRFKCHTRLCLSISDFHPDSWNPAWSVSTILTGLLSFMLERSPTLGSIETSDYTKRQFAMQSGACNLANAVFCDLFPDVVEEIQAAACEKAAGRGVATSPGSYPDIGGGVGGGNAGGFFSNALTNVIVIVGFAAFAYIIKYIVGTVTE